MMLFAMLAACGSSDPEPVPTTDTPTDTAASSESTPPPDTGTDTPTDPDSTPTAATGTSGDTATTEPIDCGDPVILSIDERGADWDAGDPATMVHGPQGGWHIGFDARATGAFVLTIDADVTLVRTGEQLAGADNTYAMILQDHDPLTCEGDLIGVIAYLDDVPVDLDAICALVGEEVVVGLTVTDPATGASDRFERTLITAPDPDDPC